MKSSIQRYIRIFKQMLKTRLGSRSWLDNATYYADAMATRGKAGSFLRSDKLWKAYHRGENSGHHLSGGQHLHIEWRVHIALSMAIHAKNLPGDFVECGVNTGAGAGQ
jgi:O-methyltransferase